METRMSRFSVFGWNGEGRPGVSRDTRDNDDCKLTVETRPTVRPVSVVDGDGGHRQDGGKCLL